MFPDENFWRRVERVPKLRGTIDITDYYAWHDGIENVITTGLLDSWDFATGSISYPSLEDCRLVESSRDGSMYSALKLVSEEGLDYALMRLPKLGRDNYIEWRGGLRLFMDAKGLYGICDGSIPRPIEGKTQSSGIPPTRSDRLEDGLENWRLGKLKNLLDDQKAWLLVDKLILCALYTTCSVEVQRSLSHGIHRNELKTSHDVLKYIEYEYGPSGSPLWFVSQLLNITRARYSTFQEFATAFRYTVRACKATDAEVRTDFVVGIFCAALGDGVENDATRRAIIRFMVDHKEEGQDDTETKLGDIIAIAERMETQRALQPTGRRNRNRNRNRGGRR